MNTYYSYVSLHENIILFSHNLKHFAFIQREKERGRKSPADRERERDKERERKGGKEKLMGKREKLSYPLLALCLLSHDKLNYCMLAK